MLKKISIDNFRGFKSLQIEDCKRFNLIIGKNNVGKTALLEALFLHIGSKNPELPLRINILRGMPATPVKDESVWSPLFHNYNSNEIISISSTDSKYKIRRLEIKLSSSDTVKILEPKEKITKEIESSITTLTKQQDRIELKYYDPENNYSISFAVAEKEGIRIENPKESELSGIFIISGGKGGGTLDSERYGNLDRKGRTLDILEILQKVEPRLKRLLTVPISLGSYVFGDIGIGQAIPIQLMGEGTSKLLTLSLAITAVPNGIVLIDEIENGLHYSIMEDIFNPIFKLASKYNVQIFATTHSNECVHAVFNSFFKESKDDLSVIRLDRIKDSIQSVVYNIESLETVFETGWEIRG